MLVCTTLIHSTLICAMLLCIILDLYHADLYHVALYHVDPYHAAILREHFRNSYPCPSALEETVVQFLLLLSMLSTHSIEDPVSKVRAVSELLLSVSQMCPCCFRGQMMHWCSDACQSLTACQLCSHMLPLRLVHALTSLSSCELSSRAYMHL